MYIHDESMFIGKKVLEIGGPSSLLSNWYPLFDSISFLNLPQSMGVHHQSAAPRNTAGVFHGDASDREVFANNHLLENFDLVISSHTLEHFANPIKALFEWKSALKRGGTIVTIVPNKDMCWDNVRAYTTFDHIIDDFSNCVTESDMTHVHEASCMIQSRPSYYSDVGEFNATRVIHHHVFSVEVLTKCHEHCGFFTKSCFIDPRDKLQMIYIGVRE